MSKKSVSPWGDVFIDIARTDVQPTKDATVRARRTRIWVWASVVTWPLLAFALVVSLMNVIKASNAQPAPAPVYLTDEQVQGRALATRELEKWLSSDNPPLPGGMLVSWDWVERVDDLPHTDPASPLDLHHFTVASSQATTLYEGQVSIILTAGGPAVFSSPTLLPKASITVEGEDLWPVHYSAGTIAIEEVDLAVKTWAQAFFSGNPAQLRQVVGDTNSKNMYLPMPPAQVDTSVLGQSALGPLGDNAAADKIIARVKISAAFTAPKKGDPVLAPYVFDVLIDGANTAAPRVVAWGGGGSGPGLKVYGNALTGVEFSPPETVPPSPSGEAPDAQ